MTQEQFQNKIDGTINDFVNGIVDAKEFRSMVMDTLLELAGPKLENEQESETVEYKFLSKYFTASGIGNISAEFYTIRMLEILFSDPISLQYFPANKNEIIKALEKLGAEPTVYRREYERFPSKGYWLIPTDELINLIQ